MTTNQTIDGVPRSIIAAILGDDQVARIKAHEELRALLDGPAIESELARTRAENERLLAGFYQQVTDADIKKISDYMGNLDMPTSAFLRQDAYDLANMTTHMCREVQALRNKLAAQHQGEPVAWMSRCLATGQCEQVSGPDEVNNLEYWSPAFPVHAEQPAPVAVTGNRTPFEIEHDAEPGDEAAFRQWRQERLNTKPTCCGSCPGGCVYGLKA